MKKDFPERRRLLFSILALIFFLAAAGTVFAAISITFPTEGGNVSDSNWVANFSYDYGDAITCSYSFDNGENWGDFPQCGDTSITPNIGGNTLIISGVDEAENEETSDPVTFTYFNTCGGETTCDCGDTVISNYALVSNMVCDGNGLIVGANSITIDGNSHTLTGDGAGGNFYNNNDYGIYDSGHNNVTIKNFSNITNFDIGINIENSNGCTIQNNTANSNAYAGAYLKESTDNNLSGNTANSNDVWGIYLYLSNDNNVTGNYANSNGSSGNPFDMPNIGIFIQNSNDNNISGNTTNTNDTWGIQLYSSSGNTVSGNNANSNGSYGIQLDICFTANTIAGNTANSNGMDGIYLFSSLHIAVNNNIVKNNSYTGIRIRSDGSNDCSNSITANTVESNQYGIFLSTCGGNNLTGNSISNNRHNFYYDSSNAYSSNQSNNNITSGMLVFNETARIKNIGETASFSVSAFDSNGADCNNCTAITTSPPETVTIDSESGNDINGHFTVTRSGTYSLTVTVTDSNSNITKRNYLFFVGNTSTQTTRYYFRGTNPTHGQAVGNQLGFGSMLFTVPNSTEDWNNTAKAQNSPDETPNYPFASLSSIDTNTWYKQSAASGAYIGAERYLTESNAVDYNSFAPAALDYNWTNKSFTDLNWAMDYPQNWYWLALKLYGTNPYWVTFPSGHSDQPSYADFNYKYTTNPKIKSVSDNNISLLSATVSANDDKNASIVLDGNGSKNIVLADYNRAFLDYNTTISSGGTATIVARNLTGITTISSANLQIVPSSGDINVSIETWNTNGNYYKKWTETGSSADINSQHSIGNMRPNTQHKLRINSTTTGTLSSNSSGQIIFNYTGGYSTKTFELLEDTPPTGGTPQTSEGNNGGGGGSINNSGKNKDSNQTADQNNTGNNANGKKCTKTKMLSFIKNWKNGQIGSQAIIKIIKAWKKQEEC